MLCFNLREFARDCSAPVVGGISDIVTFDPSDFNWTQPSPVAGVAQKYSAVALRPGAVGTGATAATATVTITAVGADGDVISVYAPPSLGGTLLGTYIKTSAETTVTLLAVALKNVINGNTGSTGYSATNLAGVITVTAPASYGAVINTLLLNVDDGGTITATTAAFSGGVTGTGGKMYKIQFQRYEAEWQWKQSRKGPSIKYDHTFNFQLPDNSQTLTTFMQALDSAAACCGLGMVIRLNSGKIFVCGEKYVNGNAIIAFDVFNEGSSGGSGKLYDDFNGANMVITGPYSRSLFEYGGTWDSILALE